MLGNKWNHFFSVKQYLFKIESSIPKWFFYYTVAYSIVLFLLVFYVPANDVDSMMAYLPIFKLTEFGSLEKTATDLQQCIFPKTFLYLHKPLLDFGYFQTLPNFLLLLIFLGIIIKKFEKEIVFFSIFFIFSCQTLLLNSTAIKYDFPSGIIAFLSWLIICYYRNKTCYLSLCSLTIAILPGIKWTAIPLAVFLLIMMMFTIYKERLINREAIILFCLCLPLYWLLSSGDVYLNNILQYGSLTPRLLVDVWGQSNSINFFKNLWGFVISSFLSTFTLPAYIIDSILHTKLIVFLNGLSGGIVNSNVHSIVTPAAGANRTGILMLILLLLDFVCLASPKFSFPIKNLALIAIAYTIILLLKIPYTTDLYCRYFLPTYILSIVPASTTLASLSSPKFLSTKIFKHWLMLYAFLVSLHCLLLSQERNLIDFTVVDVTNSDYPTVRYESLFDYDRDQLYFMGWRGYLNIYQFTREHIFPSDSLLYINTVSGHQSDASGIESPPFLYPFIKDRYPANTRIINTRSSFEDYNDLLGKYDYVMVYKGQIEHPLYDRVFEYGGPFAVNIYKLKGSPQQ